MFGKRIQLYLLDGTPNGRWICELSNWTGLAYKVPRSYVKECESRSELFSPGVYFLLGKDDCDNNSIYIGEAENVISRLLQHLDGKDYWNEVIVFISKDSNLNKAHIKYLENRFHSIAIACKRYTIMNSATPARSSISEAERSEMEEFIYNAKILINTLGHKAFEPITEFGEPDKEQMFYLRAGTNNASGILVSDGFVVLKGSIVHKDSSKYSSLNAGTIKRINECKKQGQVVDGVLQEDLLFSSSSAAGAFVTGYSVSGPQMWKTADGKTLKEIELQ